MASTIKGKNLKESRYLNSTPIEKVIEDSKLDLGSQSIVEPVRILRRNWVDTVRDLRLLHKEKELFTLVRIPDKLLKWLAAECNKRFADDTSPGLKQFIYSYDFDKNGIVYNIATDHGSKPWTNPGASGKIGVHLSSIMHDSQPGYSILGRQSVRCVTKPEKNSWVIIDFTPQQIRPTHYSLRHYSTWDTEALRCWKFEASCDNGSSWVLLSSHKNDTSLNCKGATVTWKLSECQPSSTNAANLNKYYTHFRILQTDFNSNRHYYLAISGFEIYGSMKEGGGNGGANGGKGGSGSGGAKVPSKSLTFFPKYDFDTNGIMYWLGTNRGTLPWKNPAIRGNVRIFQSSLAKDSHPAYAVVGRETVRCVTEPKKSSWFMIDLINIRVIPTHYTVRHYASFDTECIRNWRFEACNNSKNGYDGHWVTLLKHVNDTSLNHKGATHTWVIPNQNQSFSQYRLFQFGVNSNQHHYLPLSGWELYGTVVNPNNAIISQQNNFQQPSGKNNQSLIQPSGKNRVFVHKSSLDVNGLLYFLGIQGGQRHSYSNPADIGMVTVTSSSLMSDSQPLSALVGRQPTRCVTKPHQRSWMAINLKQVKIKLTHYTLRHYNSWDTEALRYWNLEGSNDGTSWIPIRQHMDDRSLRKAGLSHTWAVDAPQFFSHFRIYMTGRNSNNHWYLACSGMELYGNAFGGIVSQKHDYVLSAVQKSGMPASPSQQQQQALLMNKPQQPQQAFMMPNPNMIMNNMQQQQRMPMQQQQQSGATFNYFRDFDNNGVCYFLGTRCNTQQWQNPMKLGSIQVRTSGLMHDSTAAHCVVGRQSTRCVTKPTKISWMIVDFLDYAINPTHYTLRHYASWDTEALRNWRLEGSLDGEYWKIIREHHNDESLRFKGQSFTWKLPATSSFYSMFRLYQFDKNSNNHYYLSCSGFEIYGSVIRKNPHLIWDEWPRNKSKHLKVDRIKNSVTNTGSDDTWQTIKTREALIYNNLGINSYTILVEKAENTSNSWKFMAGIAPDEFTCTGSRQWLGSQGSWAYIGGTGGKCFNAGKSVSYGKKWGIKSGDTVTCISDIKKKTIEFILNKQSQGIAFNNYQYKNRNLYAAVSITATGSRLRLMEIVTPQSKPPINNQQAPINQFGNMNISAPKPPPPNMQPQPIMPQQQSLGGWDTALSSPHLAVFPDGVSVTNKGSNDTWQGIVGKTVFNKGKRSFEIQIINESKTSNQWKYIFGVAPLSFDPKRTAWLGSQNSWGYIGGTGGKCHNVGKSVAYGKRFGGTDIIKCVCDFNRRTIEFFKNGKSQGVAFNNLNGAVRPAVSLTGKGSCVRIRNVK